jgi:uncharacterized protein
MANVIIWADIPVADLDRASKFYEHVTQRPVMRMEGGMDVAVLMGPEGEYVVSADLYVSDKAGADGVTVYLSPNGDVDAALARVVEAGGEILQEKQNMGEMVGWIAFFRDTEGNRLGFQIMDAPK